jgi:GT2 family glycosyltransferase
MPFGGPSEEAASALESLYAVDVRPGDELILADNSPGAGSASEPQPQSPGGVPVTVVAVSGERSPAHARNAGAAEASAEWILFLDSDCWPLPDLLEAYFAVPVSDDVGALAGEVVGSSDGRSLAERYGTARNFLSQQDHMSHPFLPRAAAANLLVRRSAFAAVGGFYEGVRAAEDTDFTWRLQQAGWRLELRREARVEHRYRASVAQLRRQWRSYAAGRAWLARRYDGFAPEPAVVRGLGRLGQRLRVTVPKPDREARPTGAPSGVVTDRSHGGPPAHSWRENAPFLALDALLAFEELAGFALSNRPGYHRSDGGAEVILVADEFPRRGDPLVELAATLGRARIEAVARPKAPDLEAARELTIHYLEDDGAAMRAAAALTIAAVHPLRVLRDLSARGSEEPSTWSLAPAARRLERDRSARVHALGGTSAHARARRLARLASRPIG